MQVCFGKTRYFVRILIMWSRETIFILRTGRHVIVCSFVSISDPMSLILYY